MDEVVLALGGGGVKRIAHVGMMRVLEKEGFKVHAIAGTSVGGLVGALYASGHTSDEIDGLLKELNMPEPSPIPLPSQLIEQLSRMRFSQAFQIFVTSNDTTSRMLAELRMQQEHPDVIIRPAVEQFGILDRVDPQELILIGEMAARKALPEIRQALSWSNQITRYFIRAEPPGIVYTEPLETDQR